MTITFDDLFRLLLSVLIGGLIGAEREFRDKAAGFRTMILICFGATLFTMFSLRLGDGSDPVRIAANIVSGVGFLGAGAILRDRGRVVGLTTASTIWLAAALGMGVGGGHYIIVGSGTLIILAVLWLFPTIENWIDRARMSRTYKIVLPSDGEKVKEIDDLFRACGLKVSSHDLHLSKDAEDMICTWDAYGRLKAHESLVGKLLLDTSVREIHF
jgi:putative Mg2+ transporter-C (MgtC) family protein